MIKSWQETFLIAYMDKDSKKLIALMYLLNDILQKSRIQKSDTYITLFENQILLILIKKLADTPFIKLKLIVGNLLHIWREKRIFPKQLVSELL